MISRLTILSLALAAVLIAGCLQDDTPLALVYSYKVINVYPHDPAAFTEGLIFSDGFLYEGTGLYGQSSLCQVDLESGDVIKSRRLPDQFFGEGLTQWDDKLIQLTWKSNLGFVWDRENFSLIEAFSYPREGWGITHDDRRLIISDGTSTLHFLSPKNFQEIGQIQVNDNGVPVDNLNELEYVQGEIYANIWKTNSIARISPETGKVLGWIDLSGLSSKENSSDEDVLNGIAYDAENDRLFVTGKLWPKLFEIKLVAKKIIFL
ncbi:MAG: glutaminyl-peptide cyclotransferase [Methanotrichaceae archaeon]